MNILKKLKTILYNRLHYKHINNYKCINSSYCIKCNLCNLCNMCIACIACLDCINCITCWNCYKCINCINCNDCTNCINCINLKHQNILTAYFIDNKEVSKEEFLELLGAISY